MAELEPTNRSSSASVQAVAWGLRDILTVLFIVLMMVVLVSAALSLLVDVLGGRGSGENQDATTTIIVLIGQAVIDGLAVGIAAWLSLRKYRLSPRAWGLRRTQPLAIRASASVLIGAFAVFILYRAVTELAGLKVLEPTSNVPPWLVSSRAIWPLAMALVVLVAPLAEELFFRGFLFQGLRSVRLPGIMSQQGSRIPLGTPGAAVLSGLLWAAIHGQLNLLIPITLIGVLFAMVFVRTGSLWNAVLAHLLFNLVGFTASIATQSTM